MAKCSSQVYPVTRSILTNKNIQKYIKTLDPTDDNFKRSTSLFNTSIWKKQRGLLGFIKDNEDDDIISQALKNAGTNAGSCNYLKITDIKSRNNKDQTLYQATLELTKDKIYLFSPDEDTVIISDLYDGSNPSYIKEFSENVYWDLCDPEDQTGTSMSEQTGDAIVTQLSNLTTAITEGFNNLISALNTTEETTTTEDNTETTTDSTIS